MWKIIQIHVFIYLGHTFRVDIRNQKTADSGYWRLVGSCHTFSAYQKRDSMGTLFIQGRQQAVFLMISKMTRESLDTETVY